MWVQMSTERGEEDASKPALPPAATPDAPSAAPAADQDEARAAAWRASLGRFRRMLLQAQAPKFVESRDVLGRTTMMLAADKG